MKTFTQNEKSDAISLLNKIENKHPEIEIPLQQMFDEFMSFVSVTTFEQ